MRLSKQEKLVATELLVDRLRWWNCLRQKYRIAAYRLYVMEDRMLAVTGTPANLPWEAVLVAE